MRQPDFRTPVIGIDSVEHEARLLKLWETAPGIKGFFTTVDHKDIGIRYIITAFIFLALGGIEALLMRLQLAGPNLSLLTPAQYNQLFSTHGMTMIFLYAAPILSGFSNYLWPLLLGSRDMAFPRLNALSYWIYLASGLFMYAGFLTGNGPNDGWFNYVPYASRDFNPGLNQDFYALGMVFFGISTTVGAVNFVVTAFRMRAPGMSINRVPIMVWGTLTANVANVLVVPSVSLAFFMLWMDRQFGTHFFDPAGGGQPLLWQHLFWIFAHPWVYAIVLPAMGMVSDALPVFCRRRTTLRSFRRWRRGTRYAYDGARCIAGNGARNARGQFRAGAARGRPGGLVRRIASQGLDRGRHRWGDHCRSHHRVDVATAADA